MKLVDTHCHLDFPDYKDDIDGVIKRAEEAGVVRMIVPGTNVKSSSDAAGLASKYPSIFASAGIHPHSADKVTSSDVSEIRRLAATREKIVAIGEIGLDYYKGFSNPENQKKIFKELLITAKELDLPVILHNRSAGEDFIRILKEVFPSRAKGVVHCFSEDTKFLSEIIALGLFVSFTGSITFEKASNLREVIKFVPLEKLLLETDSPYITPVPLRGRRNEPAYVKYLLGVHAKIYDLSEDDIARITTHNANSFFGLGIKEEEKIVYPIRSSLYVNLTNRCTNACSFCTRNFSDYVKGHNLRLSVEPLAKEVIEAIGSMPQYKEIVFCGYGEPTLRLEAIKEVSAYAKKNGVKVRLTTNGHGNLINGRRIAPELKNLVDTVSISLNSPDSSDYDKLCRPVFGEKAYPAILDFIKDCVQEGVEVELTCLDLIGEEAVAACRRTAEELGAKFRLRYHGVVG